jgi:catechol 2,3-dioxygenase
MELRRKEAIAVQVAHLGHCEIQVPDLEESKKFFVGVLGLTMSHEDDKHVYLRAWQDFEHHTLILTEGAERGVGHIAFRVAAPGDLEQFSDHFEQIGIDHEWMSAGSEEGQGEAIRFMTPGGIPMELYWEMEKFRADDPEMASPYPSFPQKTPLVGVAPRRIDHVNVIVDDVVAEQEWITQNLGILHRYYTEAESGVRTGSWLSITNLSHDIALMRNQNQDGGLLHHPAYFLDSPDDLLKATTVIPQYGGKIEWGPGMHATSGARFLYFMEPGGNRVEVWTGGMMIFAPDWEPIRWEPEVANLGFNLWETLPPETFFTHGSRPVTLLGSR